MVRGQVVKGAIIALLDGFRFIDSWSMMILSDPANVSGEKLDHFPQSRRFLQYTSELPQQSVQIWTRIHPVLVCVALKFQSHFRLLTGGGSTP